MAKPPALTEADFARQVDDLAAILGYEWLHLRPARTAHGWRTPVEGSLGRGWPDRIYVRARDRRIVVVELKRDGQKPTPEQQRVLNLLSDVLLEPDQVVRVWTPAQFDEVERTLR